MAVGRPRDPRYDFAFRRLLTGWRCRDAWLAFCRTYGVPAKGRLHKRPWLLAMQYRRRRSKGSAAGGAPARAT